MLEQDGWYLIYIKGDHRQFKHETKKGKVTVNGKLSDTLSQELLISIWKQAGRKYGLLYSSCYLIIWKQLLRDNELPNRTKKKLKKNLAIYK